MHPVPIEHLKVFHIKLVRFFFFRLRNWWDFWKFLKPKSCRCRSKLSFYIIFFEIESCLILQRTRLMCQHYLHLVSRIYFPRTSNLSQNSNKVYILFGIIWNLQIFFERLNFNFSKLVSLIVDLWKFNLLGFFLYDPIVCIFEWLQLPWMRKWPTLVHFLWMIHWESRSYSLSAWTYVLFACIF